VSAVISLRQHIFSLVAVFVALAVGIAAGSTVVRGPLLDSTRARLESAEELIELERAENDQLAAELAQLDSWVDDGPGQLLAGRLAGAAVLVMVVGDVDGDVVEGVLRSVQASAGPLLGELRIDPLVFDPDQQGRVGGVLGIELADTSDGNGSDGNEGDADAEGVDPTIAMTAFGARLAELTPSVVEAIVDEEGVVGGEVLRDVFGNLEDAGLLDLLDVSGQGIAVEQVEVLVVTDRNLVNDPTPMLDALITMSDPAGPGVRVLVAEVNRVAQDNDAPVPSYVERIRSDGRLRDEVSTVDNAETFLGWIATVLGLEAARDGVVGHYGFRDGADGAVPSRVATRDE